MRKFRRSKRLIGLAVAIIFLSSPLIAQHRRPAVAKETGGTSSRTRAQTRTSTRARANL